MEIQKCGEREKYWRVRHPGEVNHGRTVTLDSELDDREQETKMLHDCEEMTSRFVLP